MRPGRNLLPQYNFPLACYVEKLTTTCLPIIGICLIPVIVVSTDKEG